MPTTENQSATLQRDAAAAYLGLRPSTLERWSRECRGPLPLKLSPARSGRVVYLRRELDEWLAAGAPRDQREHRPGVRPAEGFSRPAGHVGRDQRGRFAKVGRDA
jgi:hypothetical protein